MANDADLRIGWEDGQLRTGSEASVAAIQASVARMEAMFKDMGRNIQASMAAATASAGQMGAGIEAATAKMGASFLGMQTGIDEAKTRINGFGAAFAKVQSTIIGIGAVLAGGALFGKVIGATVEWTGEAVKLSKTLGITTEQASVLNLALGDIHQTSETVTAAAAKITKTLNTQESAFAALGVATRDQNGHLRSTLDIMADANVKLLEFREGTDRNIEGTKIYGKSWGEVAGILKLTPQVLADAKTKADALHLVVGPEGVAKTKAYRAAMNDVQDAGKSLAIQFGDALLPTLTRVGAFMGQEGPAMSGAFKVALQGVAFVAGAVWLTLKDMGDGIGALAAQAAAVLSGDFAMAKRIGQLRDEQAAKNKAAFEQWKIDAFTEMKFTPTAAEPVGDKRSRGGKEDKGVKEKSRMGEWEAAWTERKAFLELEASGETKYREGGKAAELKYWQDILAMTNLSEQERVAARRKAAELRIGINKEQFETELAGLKKEEVETGKNAEAKIAIAKREVDLVADQFGRQSKEYEAAQAHMIEITRAAAEQKRQIADLIAQAHTRQAAAEIDAAQADAQLQVQLGLITQAQLLQQEAGFENQKTALMRQALIERKALIDPDRDPVAYAQINAQIEELEAAHQARQGQIKRQATLEQNRDMLGMFHSMEGGFANVIKGVLSGTMSATKAVQGMVAAVANAVVGMLAQMAAKWLVTKLMQVVLGKTTAAAEIADQAAAAGAGGTASMAAAPFPFNLGAPAFGLAMAGAAASFSAGLSAAGGFDIPAGLNPITQLHQSEMVLPAHIADPLRQSLAGGGGLGGDTHLHVHAVDAASVERLFRDNGHLLARELRRQVRNFAPSKS